ncbi:FAD-dependent oxidoreductase [Candidatus Acetothermia bacterium]|jgi:thioredoxin reductase (NADPH)|nr:FAD-dependent oxidoreductase [Candidatus Acetothermia bacterium]MCI2427930.1 FAD-dependent oxidoreductase [Candidatus Acetothermia bacterium]MCI2427972.1 FAD-dependent oxidoreductase [Candidatus Acetothermia bacterium]
MPGREKRVEEYDVVIIGGGAAGMTAGIYTGRARLKTVLIEKALVGGLATYTNEIENYPGFPEGTTGLEMMNLFQKQAKKFGVTFKLTDVKSVDLTGETKIVETFRTTYKAKVVIIASGGRPRTTGAKNEEKFLFDKGISFCATCDAASCTDQELLVVGSGDTAIEEGLFLTKFAKKIYVSVIHDQGKMDCNEIAREAAFANPKMEFLWNTVVDSFEGDDQLEQVVLKNLKTKKLEPIKVDRCFEFIGYLPNTEIFQNQVKLTDSGFVLTNERMETNIEGVFAAGDVRDKFLKQVATAVGDGAIAGFAAEKYITESEVFYRIIEESRPYTLVYVYNAADAASRELLPIMEELEKEGKEQVKAVRVDVYKSTGIASRLNVTEYPCVAVVKNGEVIKLICDISKEKIQSAIC